MAQFPVFRFQRGEPIIIGREIVGGVAGSYTLTATLHRTRGLTLPRAPGPVAATFDVFLEPIGPGLPHARWMLLIEAGVSATLLPGSYVTEAVFWLDGAIAARSEPAFIIIQPSVGE